MGENLGMLWQLALLLQQSVTLQCPQFQPGAPLCYAASLNCPLSIRPSNCCRPRSPPLQPLWVQASFSLFHPIRVRLRFRQCLPRFQHFRCQLCRQLPRIRLALHLQFRRFQFCIRFRQRLQSQRFLRFRTFPRVRWIPLFLMPPLILWSGRTLMTVIRMTWVMLLQTQLAHLLSLRPLHLGLFLQMRPPGATKNSLTVCPRL